MVPLVELRSASKIYKQADVKTLGIVDISMQIRPGDFVAITGRSGCGKSTLLNILGLMDNLTSGRYLFCGKDITKLNRKKAAAFRNQQIGYVFQAFNLINEISVLDNVCLPLGYAGVRKTEREERALKMLELVHMEEKKRKRPIHLSGGEQQRVAIARAIVNNPKLLLADEPTGNLDEVNSRSVMELFTQLNRSGMTILMVTHTPEIARYAEKQIRIRDGQLVSIYVK